MQMQEPRFLDYCAVGRAVPGAKKRLKRLHCITRKDAAAVHSCTWQTAGGRMRRSALNRGNQPEKI
jgi:hypothetical protein